MGPSMIVDGDDPEVRPVEREGEASMGPSMIVDGDADRVLPAARAAVASMGPSMIVDGDLPSAPCSCSYSAMLQWGRR